MTVLGVQAHTCVVTYGQRKDASALAASPNVTHSPNGITACDPPIRADAKFKEVFASKAADVVAQINKPISLPLV